MDKLFDTDQKPCECAPHITENPNALCSSDKIIKKIGDYLNIEETNPPKIIEKAKEQLLCTTESCVLAKINDDEVKKELSTRFKVSGPADSTKLLSNIDIDGTMRQWAQKWHDFYPIEFQFMNFAERDTEFQNINYNDIYSKKFRTISSVLNTDFAAPGKHWVCVFVDLRSPKWTIEYFNSSGNRPTMEVITWMLRSKTQLQDLKSKIGENPADVEQIAVSNVVHQESKTECGVYVLYYIYNRLKGRPYTDFRDRRVPDEKITKFRKHLFIEQA